MTEFCLFGYHLPSHLLLTSTSFACYFPPDASHSASTQPLSAGTSRNAEKNSSIGVKEMKGKSQKGKCLQVFKNTSPEIKLN